MKNVEIYIAFKLTLNDNILIIDMLEIFIQKLKLIIKFGGMFMEKIFFILAMFIVLKYVVLIIILLNEREKSVVEIILEILIAAFLYIQIKRPLITVGIMLIDFLVTNMILILNIIMLKYIAFEMLVTITNNTFLGKTICIIFNKIRLSKKLNSVLKVNYGPKLKRGLPGMAGKVHKKTKVEFDNNGFPKFKARYTIYLKKEDYGKSREAHFNYANKEVYKKAIDSKLVRKLFTKKELAQMKMGNTPEKYTWHHHQDKGKLQLVSRKIHSEVNHIGGYSIWGGE